MLNEFDKNLNRNINKIKKAVERLRRLGLEIVIDKNIETMTGSLVDHIYVIDRLKLSGKIILQKHLFTIEQHKTIKRRGY